MTTRTDVFARWLAVLADSMVEPGLNTGDFADRVHLSRFHLDRIVSAVAGESPKALQRRILLERAAFRLASSPVGVLDVAIEAGYGSGEAFTRAFHRAYGQAPARWRDQPAPLLIPADNGIHFLPPAGLRLPAQRQESAMELLEKMVDHHVWLTGRIIECAGELTAEQLDDPIVLSVDDDPDPATLRRLVSRLVGQLQMWNDRIAHRAYDFDVEIDESLTSARRRLELAGPTFRAQVSDAIQTDRLDETFVDASCDPPRVMTYGAMIAHVLTFASHRRTLAVLALDKYGVTQLGWGDPVEWIDAELHPAAGG